MLLFCCTLSFKMVCFLHFTSSVRFTGSHTKTEAQQSSFLIVSKTQRIRPFPSCLVPLFQSESWCIAFHMKMSFHSYVDKTHFHMKGFARGLALKKRYKTIRKWHILPLTTAKTNRGLGMNCINHFTYGNYVDCPIKQTFQLVGVCIIVIFLYLFSDYYKIILSLDYQISYY